MAKKVTWYEALVDHANKAAEKYPGRFVVLDSSTYKVLGRGKDLHKLWTRVQPKLKSGQMPLVMRKSREDRARAY